MAVHLPPHVLSFISSLSPTQFQSVMSQLQGPGTSHFVNALSNALQPHPMGGAPVQGGASISAAVEKKKKKRSLNCFVAFRCYISPIFDNFQQKERSTFVSILWKGEMTKAKWTILAKAYSIIRDQVGSNNAPMDQFLVLACPHIGIVDRNAYLQTFGWELISTGAGSQVVRRHDPDASSFPDGFFTTMLSVGDIVKHVRDFGYGPVPNSAPAAAAASGSPSSSMLTMAAQPAPQAAQPVAQAALTAPPAAHGATIISNTPTQQPAQPTPQAAQPAVQVVPSANHGAIISHTPAHQPIQTVQPAQTVQPVQQTTQPLPAIYTVVTHMPAQQPAQYAHQFPMLYVPGLAAPGIATYGLRTGQWGNAITKDASDDTAVHDPAHSLSDPQPSSINADHQYHVDPELYTRSHNSTVHSSQVVRPYYPGPMPMGSEPDAPTNVQSEGDVDGSQAFEELASDLWQSASQWPYNDNFLPGQDYPLFTDREIAPDFSAFDMADDSNWAN